MSGESDIDIKWDDDITGVFRSAEYDQTWTGVHRVKMWGGLGEEDILISASVDEILDRWGLWHDALHDTLRMT